MLGRIAVNGYDGQRKRISAADSWVNVQRWEKEAPPGHDLYRITPRGFLQLPACRDAIIKELAGLTRITSRGVPEMTIVDGSAYQYCSLRKYTR